MHDTQQQLDYIEQTLEATRMQNRVLATAFKGLIRALPPQWAEEAVASIQAAFEDELAQLEYEDSPHTDLFHDVTYAFFRERE